MPRSIKSCWQVGWLFVAVAFAGCATETSPSGDLAIELELVDGVEIDEVSYSVTGNGIAPMTGAIDTSAPGTTASVELYGIPAGDKYIADVLALARPARHGRSRSVFHVVGMGNHGEPARPVLGYEFELVCHRARP